MPRSPIPVSLPISLAPGNGAVTPRIVEEIVRLIASGRVREGETLPSTRTLATELGVSRSAAVAAYDELAATGYLLAVPGSKTTVEDGAAARARSVVPEAKPVEGSPCPAVVAREPLDFAFHLEPGYSDVEQISRRAWNSAWRVARDDSLRTDPIATEAAMTIDDSGHAALRSQLVGHLRRTRNIVCSPDDIFVFPQVTSAVTAIVGALDLAPSTVAFEDPGHFEVRNSFAASGCRVRAVEIDEDGVSPESLEETDAIVYTTPEHQIPLGGRMSLDRRSRLLEHARVNDSMIFETDYDGCFRYQTAPLPAIRSMKDGCHHVIYLGTSSASLHKGLRVTWAVVPRRYREQLAAYLHLTGGDTVCTMAARAVAEFIQRGSMLRHLASSSRVYGARQRRFVEACENTIPSASVRRERTGLHVVLVIPPRIDDAAVADTLFAEGLSCWSLRSFYESESSTTRRSGLLCGFARLPEDKADEAASLIARTLSLHGA